MVRSNLTHRCAAAASLLLHVLVLGLLPLADARLEAAELEQTVHIEADRDAGCAPGHDSLSCEFCRTLRAPSRSPCAVSLVATPSLSPELAERRGSVVPHRARHQLNLHSRAPPAASHR